MAGEIMQNSNDNRADNNNIIENVENGGTISSITAKDKSNNKKIIFVSIFIIAIVAFLFFFGNDLKNGVSRIQNSSSETVDLSDYNVLKQGKVKPYKAEPIKGIFLTANTAGISSSLDALIQLANQTEINAFVIDVKNDFGNVTYNMDIKQVDEIGSEYIAIKDINKVMDKLYNNNIYPIARIVAFKDPYLSSHKTEYAIKNKDGSLFQYKNVSWVSPYNKDAWKYIVDIAKEAALSGFKEIQFDYIRFEATYSLENADFGHEDSYENRMEIIVDFIEYAKSELEPYGVVVSADVFGTIIVSEIDAKMIGQNYLEMSKSLDVICPMVYPSHYGRGYYGVPASKSPDLYPYEIIYGSMMDSNNVINKITSENERPVVRPWLQAFTASYLGGGNYMTYDGKAIQAQIKAVKDAGLEEWLLWNSGNRYSKDGLSAK